MLCFTDSHKYIPLTWISYVKDNGHIKVFWSSNHVTIISNDNLQDNWLLFHYSACDFIVIVKAASNLFSRNNLRNQLENRK